mgnify:CR=1 FL=1
MTCDTIIDACSLGPCQNGQFTSLLGRAFNPFQSTVIGTRTKIELLEPQPADLTITDGERVAQLVFCKVEKVNLIQVQELGSSERGEGGFGSTGVK